LQVYFVRCLKIFVPTNTTEKVFPSEVPKKLICLFLNYSF